MNLLSGVLLACSETGICASFEHVLGIVGLKLVLVVLSRAALWCVCLVQRVFIWCTFWQQTVVGGLLHKYCLQAKQIDTLKRKQRKIGLEQMYKRLILEFGIYARHTIGEIGPVQSESSR